MKRILLFVLPVLAASGLKVEAQVFQTNLVVNGDAESGPASTDQNRPVTSIPSWNRVGNPDVVTYGSSGRLSKNGPAPANHGSNYFIGGPANGSSALTQDINVTAGSSNIDAGNVVFTASAYLGGLNSDTESVSVSFAFKNVTSQTLSTYTLGPVTVHNDIGYDGLYLRRGIGLVPAGTRTITVTLQMTGGSSTYNQAAADNISLVLNPPGAAQSVLSSNLIVNGDAEAGPAMTSDQDIAADVPGWSRTGHFNVEKYSNDGNFPTNAPGPSNRGNNYFSGGKSIAMSTGYQDIDVSSASSLIDGGSVQFQVQAWLGGYQDQNDSTTLTAQFENWSGTVLGNVQLGPVTASDRNNQTSLLLRQQSGKVPTGTRHVLVTLTMTRTNGDDNNAYADNISLMLGTLGPPTINSGGIVTASDFGGFKTIAPGDWIEIYGLNLSTTTRGWGQADFNGSQAPTTLDGISVTVNGQPAYVDYISPTQVNALVPSTVGTGPAQVVVTNSQGASMPYSITVNPTQAGLLAPASFQYNGKQYAEAFLSDGKTLALPSGAISGLTSKPAKPGDTIVLYGVGFGPVTPAIPAGTVVSQNNTLSLPLQVSIGGVPAGVAYDGLAPGFTGLYQINVVVPLVSNNDAVPITFNLGGVPSAQTLYIAVHD